MNKKLLFSALLLCTSTCIFAQDKKIIDNIVKEVNENTQLEKLAHELLDVVGPRLVGSPQMKQANDWAVKKYSDWGISAKNEKWGEWAGWERGITHIDLISPRVRTLEGTQLAWSPSTNGKTINAEAIILPAITDSVSFQKWLPNVKGKIVLISMNQLSGRPEKNWEEFATKDLFEKFKKEKADAAKAWIASIAKTGLTAKTLPVAIENAGAVAVVINNWSQGFGVDKIFGANTKKVPTLDLSVEDYGLVYRLALNGDKPRLKIEAESKKLGTVPTFNTLAEIKGTQKPNEYVMLSAHFDSWDGASGATDNGSGTILMMEAMRILKKIYPNPKRTILVGHWGSEEQGLNGSRAFVEDHPEIVSNLQALFNQDNGTGRVVNIGGQGFAKSKDYITRWLAAVPDTIKNQIKTSFPGSPGAGGSDFASFVAAGALGYSLSSTSWDYGTYTWHTNRDSYDKLVFDEIKSNVILAAIMVYMASEDPEKTSTEKATDLPVNERTGKPAAWPVQTKSNRKGGL
ncbi:Aminopeptidase YwaD [Pedobacter sp. Bi27]|uniref:M20/M25/M40 family metallo-hydrolase n=1 Tax=unclassified Pedobacter TaxID=2628915 RepID=UPI001D382895|nr:MULTISPECIES: M20/M25/M40 family metallo-hydrolase [unclassified Pedobacter]CAH0268843.1 Aminopeptidase YwaD [Pedobacter sp. Bi36]CAH0294713.1 Aminopeptidase YwaD [Pedobacter sp. Bi27]CAH0301861.1 Aminopeptidase YwaD [Pedobacter sp. Bi126]